MLGADKSERIINGKADSYGSTDDRSGNLLSVMDNRERSDIPNGGKRKNTASRNDVTEGPKDGYLICNKWLSLFFCLFFGVLGAHKFYEGRLLLGFMYLFTGGFLCIGWLCDIVIILFKPNPYYILLR